MEMTASTDTIMSRFMFHHYQSVSMDDFYPFSSSAKPRDSFLLDIDKFTRVVVHIDIDNNLLDRFILQYK